MRPKIHHSLRKLTGLIALAILVATIAGLLSEVALVFELLCHFRVQYLLLSLLVLLVFIFIGHWRWAVLALIAAGINAYCVLPWYFASHQQVAAEAPSIRLLQSNLSSGNKVVAGLLHLVAQEQPDLLLLQEFTDHWGRALKSMPAELSHAVALPRGDNFGIAIFSRWPIIDSEILSFGGMGLPVIRVQVKVNDQPVTVIAAHPPPPIGGELYRERNQCLRQLAGYVAGLTGPVIVAGDLNCSMWSHHYRPLEDSGGLYNVRAGFGVLPTWPAGFAPMAIPLDHCLVSKGIAVADLRVGPDIGSDHLPLIVDLSVRRTTANDGNSSL